MKYLNKIFTYFLNLLLVIFPHLCLAQAAAPLQTEKALLQTFVGLILVLGLIFSLAWLNKRMGGMLTGTHNMIKVLGAVSVGSKEKVVLIEVGGKQILLGVTQAQINNLTEVEAVFPVGILNERPKVRELDIKKKTPVNELAATSASEFSQKLREFLYHGKKS